MVTQQKNIKVRKCCLCINIPFIVTTEKYNKIKKAKFDLKGVNLRCNKLSKFFDFITEGTLKFI